MNTQNKLTLVWDIPTRIFHWLLVIGFGLQWLTGEVLDNAIDWHFYIGYSMLGLIVFRIFWGFFGTRYAKFSQFLTAPRNALRYAKTLPDRDSAPHTGHNPLGGWVVIIMLLLIGLQAVSGLFVSDDIFSEGPYRSVASSNVKEFMEFIHFNLFDVLIALVCLHIVAVFSYQFYKKQRLINAMLHGKKAVSGSPISSSRLLIALILATITAILVYVLVAVLPPQPELYF